MHGRPKLGKQRMITVATRVEPDEVQRLRELAEECGLSLCGYMRELIRRELGRAERTDHRETAGGIGARDKDKRAARNGSSVDRNLVA